METIVIAFFTNPAVEALAWFLQTYDDYIFYSYLTFTIIYLWRYDW